MWTDRCLLLGPRLALVTSQRQFRRAVKSINVDDADQFCDPAWHACTNSYEVDGELVCVVGVNLPAMEKRLSTEGLEQIQRQPLGSTQSSRSKRIRQQLGYQCRRHHRRPPVCHVR